MDKQGQQMTMGWGRFAATIGVATVIMFFLMYQLIYSMDHATFAMTRLISAFVMGATMSAIMLAFMWNMFKSTAVKVAVLVGSLVLAAGFLIINRNETLIDDESFMKSMIPHHSIAINNAEKASISDPRVRKLADEIISSQVREIREMKLLLADIEHKGERGTTPLPPIAATVTPDMEPKIREAVQ